LLTEKIAIYNLPRYIYRYKPDIGANGYRFQQSRGIDPSKMRVCASSVLLRLKALNTCDLKNPDFLTLPATEPDPRLSRFFDLFTSLEKVGLYRRP
jgi:hypothetical protein